VEFIEASHCEWCDMWQALSEHHLNNGDPICLFMDECWEYMGSTTDHHNFRHLKHPRTCEKEFAYIERSRTRLAWVSWSQNITRTRERAIHERDMLRAVETRYWQSCGVANSAEKARFDRNKW